MIFSRWRELWQLGFSERWRIRRALSKGKSVDDWSHADLAAAYAEWLRKSWWWNAAIYSVGGLWAVAFTSLRSNPGYVISWFLGSIFLWVVLYRRRDLLAGRHGKPRAGSTARES